MCRKFNILVVDNQSTEQKVKQLSRDIQNTRAFSILLVVAFANLAIQYQKLSTKIEELNKKGS